MSASRIEEVGANVRKWRLVLANDDHLFLSGLADRMVVSFIPRSYPLHITWRNRWIRSPIRWSQHTTMKMNVPPNWFDRPAAVWDDNSRCHGKNSKTTLNAGVVWQVINNNPLRGLVVEDLIKRWNAILAIRIQKFKAGRSIGTAAHARPFTKEDSVMTKNVLQPMNEGFTTAVVYGLKKSQQHN